VGVLGAVTSVSDLGRHRKVNSVSPERPDKMTSSPSFRTWIQSHDPSVAPAFDELRRRLFDLDGYCVLRSFCSVEDTVAIRRFWHRYPLAVGPKGYWPGRTNYAMEGPATVQRYECMFWNPPEDPLTYELAWSALLLRNVIWNLPLHSNVFSFDRFACSYRPTRSDAGDPGVRAHRDTENRAELSHRVQVSVALSTLGADFLGGGTRIKTHSGRVINIHESETIAAGDLLLFDQLLEHSVDSVIESDPSNPLSGHWRLLMPEHPIGPAPPWRRARFLRGVRRLWHR
jgi:hypothetical protein